MKRFIVAAVVAITFGACSPKPSDSSTGGPAADAAFIQWINHGMVRTQSLDVEPAGCSDPLVAPFCERASEVICDGSTLVPADPVPTADGGKVQTCHWTCTHQLEDGVTPPDGFVEPSSFTFVVTYDQFGVVRSAVSTFAACE